ncbi:MAG TPA: class I adenylate-forming enzyme family protein [Pyrinomonadaceae bacterium]
MKKTINDYVLDSISRYPEKTFLIEWSAREEVTYAAFGERLNQVGNVLRKQGVSEGDVVTLISDNSIDMAIMMYGVIVYGAIAKALNPKLTSLELGNIVSHSGSRIVFSSHQIDIAGFAGRMLDIAAYRNESAEGTLRKDFDRETGAELIYTSGTTGTPKGVLLSHRNIVHNVTAAIDRLRLDHTHTTLCILPLFHNFAFISDLSTMIFCGGSVVIMEGFDISRLGSVEAALMQHEVNSFSAVPLMFELFLRFNCRINPPSMKFCVSGAAPLKEKVAVEFLKKYAFPIVPAYGLTESTCFCTISPLEAIDNTAVGVPVDEIKIISDNNEELGPYEIGELIVKGESVMRGSHFRSDDHCYVDAEGTWLKTGDLGFYDQKHYVHITGRKKNMAIRGGEKIYLEDVDLCLTHLPGIAESSTIIFEELEVEKIACFVVLDGGSKLSSFDVLSFLRESMGQLKVPDIIIIQSYLPRTATGKIKVGELRKAAESQRLQAA